eukprot:m.22947 g.22947  ORF g.22947 m.22947 type:complete len:250 (+) comp5499_c1_seq1:307-1056(+)
MASILRRVVIGGVIGGSVLYGAVKVREYGNAYSLKKDRLLEPFTSTPVLDVTDPTMFTLLNKLVQCEQANVFVQYAKAPDSGYFQLATKAKDEGTVQVPSSGNESNSSHYPIPPLSQKSPVTADELASYYPATMAVQGYMRFIERQAASEHYKMQQSGAIDMPITGVSRKERVLADATAAMQDVLRIFANDIVVREVEKCKPSEIEEMQKQHRFQIDHLLNQDAEVQREFKSPLLRYLVCLFHADEKNV